MAFNFNAHLEGYEFRGSRTGEGKNGMWMSLVLEDPDEARQLDVSVPQDLQRDVRDLSLKKGDVLSLDIRAFAGPEYSRVSLVQVTGIVDKNGEVQL